MAKQTLKKMKGVSCSTRKGEEYWSVRLGDEKVYCGKGGEGRKMAEAAKSKHIAKRYEGKEIRAGLKVEKEEFKTVRELLNWYMTEIPSVQAKKGYRRKSIAAGHIMRCLGDKRVGDIEAVVQENYRETRKGEGAAENTINVEIQTLRAAYNAARRNKKIHAEFMPGYFVIVDHITPRRTVTDYEFAKILAHADLDFQDILICGFESAMRSDEICKLTASQVRLNVQHITGRVVDCIDLGVFDTKTGARRTVPVASELKEVLQRRLKSLGPEDRVFTINGKDIYNQVIVNNMITVCKRAGVPYGDKVVDKKGNKTGIVFHSFRHTRTSRWVEAGFSDEIVRRATGHKSLEAYQTYVKLDPIAVMRLVEPKTGKNGTKTNETLARP